jgi:hypothetical protein
MVNYANRAMDDYLENAGMLLGDKIMKTEHRGAEIATTE